MCSEMIWAIATGDDSGGFPRPMERRDGRARVQLYDRYGRLVYAAVLRIVRDQAAAEDLVQETFLHAWSRAKNIDGLKGAVAPWLLAVARNRAMGYLNSRQEQDCGTAPFEETEDPWLYTGVEARTPFAEQTKRAKQALARLPENQLQAIELACFDGLSLSGMAARLGQPPDTVKTWLLGALAALRKSMEAGAAE